MKLQVKILLPIILLMTLLLSLSGFLAYRQTAQSLSDALLDNVSGEADALVRAISDLTQTSVENVKRTAMDETVQAFYRGDVRDEGRAKALESILKRLADSYPDLERIVLLDAKGDVVSSSDLTASKIGQKFGDRDYVQSALAGKPFLAAPFKSRVTNKTVMTAAAPVTLDGKVVGAAYAAISVENFLGHD